MFVNVELGIKCPKCGAENDKSIDWIQANDSLICAGCHESVHLDKRRLISGFAQVDRSIDAFRKKNKGLNRRL